jgi:hypothetical protein
MRCLPWAHAISSRTPFSAELVPNRRFEPWSEKPQSRNTVPFISHANFLEDIRTPFPRPFATISSSLPSPPPPPRYRIATSNRGPPSSLSKGLELAFGFPQHPSSDIRNRDAQKDPSDEELQIIVTIATTTSHRLVTRRPSCIPSSSSSSSALTRAK